jgi:hypothetical protein
MSGLLSPHRQRAMQLYRHALKTCLDWSGNRQQWFVRVSGGWGSPVTMQPCWRLAGAWLTRCAAPAPPAAAAPTPLAPHRAGARHQGRV